MVEQRLAAGSFLQITTSETKTGVLLRDI